jgi:hypothetical protein
MEGFSSAVCKVMIVIVITHLNGREPSEIGLVP